MKSFSQKNYKKKSGFTLVEMLIVVFIIAVLATVAIANYGAARQKAKIDIIADTLVSVIKQQQNMSKSKDRCFGLTLDTMSPNLNLIDADYVSIKNNRADYCDDSNSNNKDLAEMEDFIIQDLKKDGTAVTVVQFYFKPPFAKVVFDGMDDGQILDNSHVITITISNPAKTEKRTIEFESTSGQVNTLGNQ